MLDFQSSLSVDDNILMGLHFVESHVPTGFEFRSFELHDSFNSCVVSIPAQEKFTRPIKNVDDIKYATGAGRRSRSTGDATLVDKAHNPGPDRADKKGFCSRVSTIRSRL